MSAFSHYSKDFAIVYYVTMAPYNSKSSSRYDVCLGALVLAYFERTRFVGRSSSSYYYRLSHGFVACS